MSIQYINYHRQPRVQFTSISEYNNKFSADVPENGEFEAAFRQAWSTAREQTDPNEHLQHTFNTEDMGFMSRLKKGAKKALTRKKKKEPTFKKKEKKKKEAGDGGWSRIIDSMTFEQPEVPSEAPAAPEALKPSLDDFLDDYDEEVADEEVAEGPSIHEVIDQFVHSQAKDSQQFDRDRAHVVHFNTMSENVASRLMKGRDRYMNRLQAYIDGDTTVKIRTMDNKEQLVADLNPCIDSLQELVNSKSGEPRFVACKCNHDDCA